MAAPMPMAIEMRGFKEKVERGRCSTLKFKTEKKNKMSCGNQIPSQLSLSFFCSNFHKNGGRLWKKEDFHICTYPFLQLAAFRAFEAWLLAQPSDQNVLLH